MPAVPSQEDVDGLQASGSWSAPRAVASKLTVKHVLRYGKHGVVLVAAVINASHTVSMSQSKEQIRKESFGKTADQQEVHVYTLTNKILGEHDGQ